MLRALLKGCRQRVRAGAEKDLSPFGRPCVDKLDRPDPAAPFPRKHLGGILLSSQSFRHGEVVLAEDAPESGSRQQMAGIVNGPEHLAKSAQEDGLVPTGAPSEPTVNRAALMRF